MKLIECNNKLVTRNNPVNNEFEYYVENNKEKMYLSTKLIKQYIIKGKVNNAYINTNGQILLKKYSLRNITSKNFSTFRNLIYKNIVSSTYENYYFESLYSKSIEQLKNTKLVYYGNEIVNISYIDTIMYTPYNIIYLNWFKSSKYKVKVTKYICSKIKDSIICLGDYESLTPYISVGFKYLNTESNIALGDKENYCFTRNLLTLGDENCLVKLLEDRLPDKIDIKKLTYKNIRDIKHSDYAKFMVNKLHNQEPLVWESESGHCNMIGFHYFKLSDIIESDKDYLLCFYGDILVGVVKYGIWGEGKEKHQAISFIDVHQKYRNCGISKYMINHLNEAVYDDLPLIITDESELGAKCHMADKMKKAVTKVKVKTYREAIEDGRYD